MDVFEISQIIDEQARGGQSYHEFLRSHDLSVGLYCLPAGATDPQVPHTEDEIYYLIKGKGVVTIDGQDQTVKEGSTIFVGKGVEHKFHSITEDLTILVVFAPPRRSKAV
jgi:mannose-6-phosphate isomerase-like protein (cupin superfamily)